MNKYTAEQVLDAAFMVEDRTLSAKDARNVAADMLREYAAHLAEQAEWPSEDDVELVCKGVFKAWPNVFEARRIREDARAALQSVRRPVGVVPDDVLIALTKCQEVIRLALKERAIQGPLSSQFTQLTHQINAALASRHAPTKD